MSTPAPSHRWHLRFVYVTPCLVLHSIGAAASSLNQPETHVPHRYEPAQGGQRGQVAGLAVAQEVLVAGLALEVGAGMWSGGHVGMW